MRGTSISIPAPGGGAYLTVPECGSGPGIVLLPGTSGVDATLRAVADFYAEEGYTVLAPDLALDIDAPIPAIAAAVAALRANPACTGKVGALGYANGGLLAMLAAARCGVDCAVGYYSVGLEPLLDELAGITVPLGLHFGLADKEIAPEALVGIKDRLARMPNVEIATYPGAGHDFAEQGGAGFDKPAAMMAHSRSVALFRRVMGPNYDLSALWDKHCEYEFGHRDVAKTMGTMVAEPYVNHIPTMTGGVGYTELYRFYQHHFVDANPDDTKLVPISRTIGADRVVDEMLFSFTHDREIDWILPGVKPTGRHVEVPLLAVICFRGDKLYNEHIYWDQASVLVQIGLLDPKLYPVTGRAQAEKLVDPSLPSNTLNPRWASSAPADMAAE